MSSKFGAAALSTCTYNVLANERAQSSPAKNEFVVVDEIESPVSNDSSVNGDIESTGKQPHKAEEGKYEEFSKNHGLGGFAHRTNSFVGTLSQAIQSRLSRNQLGNISATSSPTTRETIKCIVHFLDDTRHIFEVERFSPGEDLLALVFRHLELLEREYFALQFSETLSSQQNNFDPATLVTKNNSSGPFVYSRWLDPGKKIIRQMRNLAEPYHFQFRVKFYVSDISRLFEEFTRYHFYLQIRKDILSGKLTAIGQEETLVSLASYVLQSELGDYSESEHSTEYASRFAFVPNQTSVFESQAESLHKMHVGQTPADAEKNYLEEAKNLSMYGIDLHRATDCEGQPIQIGVSASGLSVFKENIKMSCFSWANIVKISFKRSLFYIQLNHERNERFDNLLGFNLCSYRACKSLWKSCVEQHTFFRLHTPKPLTKKFFFFLSLGSKYRYSGKTEFQTIEENKKRLKQNERIFIRNSRPNATMPGGQVGGPSDGLLLSTSVQEKLSTKVTVQSDNISPSEEDNIVLNGQPSPTPPQPPPRSHRTHSAPLVNGNSRDNDDDKDMVLINDQTIKSEGQPGGVSSATYKSNRSLTKLFTTVLSSAKQQLFTSASNLMPSSNATQITNGGEDAPDAAASAACKKKSAKFSSKSILGQLSKTGHRSRQFFKSFHSSSASIKSSDSFSSSAGSNGSNTVANGNDLEAPSSSCHDLLTTNLDDSKSKHVNGHSVAKTKGNASKKVASLPLQLAYCPSTSSSLLYIDQDSTSIPRDSLSINSSHASNGVPNGGEIPERPDSATPVAEPDTPIREMVKVLYDAAASLSEKIESDEPQDAQVVTVKMKPDHEGKFGFNIKGGKELSCPVLVSKVAKDSPAEHSYPTQLREGDQVISINNVEVAGLTHKEVISLIRANNGLDNELVLQVRPNVYHKLVEPEIVPKVVEAKKNEPTFHYTLSNSTIVKAQPPPPPKRGASISLTTTFRAPQIKSFIKRLSPSQLSISKEDDEELSSINGTLQESMDKLAEGLASRNIINHFEQLNRKNESESIMISKLSANAHKNRYLDIAPYDSTRVVLKKSCTGDYINASYVNMKIPNTQVVNRYIATQGPLKKTIGDFWMMVFEQSAKLIVMVTPLIEDGRRKCDKYWPEKNERMVENSNALKVALVDMIETDAFKERQFKLTYNGTETHYVSHLQFTAWPDQGIPDDDTNFLILLNRVRTIRKTAPEAPVVIHCSAGIGRTGVLMLMETGICLIESNQPVYPLNLVRKMRNQRAMLIQTSSQFRFVCESLSHVYKAKIVEPVNDDNGAGATEVVSDAKDAAEPKPEGPVEQNHNHDDDSSDNQT